MKHHETVAFLESFGATVETPSLEDFMLRTGWFTATLNSWKALWKTQGTHEPIEKVRLVPPESDAGEENTIPRPDGNPPDELLREFVQHALKKVTIRIPGGKDRFGMVVEYGPDAFHEDFSPSLRVRRTGIRWDRSFVVLTPEVLAIAEAVASGECNEGILLDRLEDDGIVRR